MSEQLKDFLWFMVKTGLVIIAVSTFELIVFIFLTISSYHLKLGSNAWTTDSRFFTWGMIVQDAVILGLGLRRAIKNLSRPEYNTPEGYVPNR